VSGACTAERTCIGIITTGGGEKTAGLRGETSRDLTAA